MTVVPTPRAPRAGNVAPQHPPPHAQPRARHAGAGARRGPRSVGAWVGVLALAGFALSPEQAAPAAELPGHPATPPVTHTVSMTLDRVHDTRLPGPHGTPAA